MAGGGVVTYPSSSSILTNLLEVFILKFLLCQLLDGLRLLQAIADESIARRDRFNLMRLRGGGGMLSAKKVVCPNHF